MAGYSWRVSAAFFDDVIKDTARGFWTPGTLVAIVAGDVVTFTRLHDGLAVSAMAKVTAVHDTRTQGGLHASLVQIELMEAPANESSN